MATTDKKYNYIIHPDVYITDPVPLQTPDQNRVYTFYDNLREGRLTTTRCKECGCIAWPPRVVCFECMSDQLEWVDFPDPGRIYAFTVQENGNPPGFPVPTIYALIDFDNGKRIISPIVDCDPSEVTVGAEVALKVVPAPKDRVLFFFTLKDKK
ncbi:MAG: Zn-ribbon domain-containing OB-fold protein [Syntrophorhabdales bacterium]|jgi:hypothetical protein